VTRDSPSDRLTEHRTPTLNLKHGNMCAGCQASGRCRFGMRLHPVGDGSIAGTAYFTAEHEGAGGVVHGGSSMGALDEACGAVVIATGAISVTAEMTVKFRRPVPVEHELSVRSWGESRDSRGHWIINAELSLPGETRALCSARARFVEMDPGRHYGRFRESMARRSGQVS
jgi:acyl-coenzyme A thioesterase PaaI-like protein